MTNVSGHLNRPSYDGEVFEGGGEGISLLALGNILLRRRKWIVIATLVIPAVAAIRILPRKPTYTATSSFVAEGSRPPAAGGATALASQLGVNINQGDVLNSPQFYVELVKAPWFLQDVVEARYKVGPDSGRTLIEIFNPPGSDPRAKRDRAIDWLAMKIDATMAARTGVISLNVTDGNPVLAQAINAEILRRITQFNINRRQTRASAERRFIERRLAEVSSDLNDAEAKLRAFLQENHDFTRSPALILEEKRMERNLALEQQLFTSLSASYETAKIDEVRDTPLTTVLGAPELPIKPNARGRGKALLMALALGLGLGMAIAFVIDFVNRPTTETDNPELKELARRTRAIGADLGRGRIGRGLFGSGD